MLGIVFGVLVSFWTRRIVHDSILSISVTLIGAYLCFYVAEFTVLGVSAILSVVCFGLYMAAVGKRAIFPASEAALHKVWSFIQYSCETLIFILAGVVIGLKILSRETTINSSDWGKLVL